MGRLFAAFVVTVLAVPLVMLAAATEALACSCVPWTFAAQVDSADVVFTGRAIERVDGTTGAGVSGLDPVTWLFAVERVHKGGADGRQPVVSARSEPSCGVELEPGATYVVFAREEPGGELSTGLCHGTTAAGALPPADAAALGAGAPVPVAAPPAPETPASVGVEWWQLATAGGIALLVAGLAAGAVVRRRRRT